MSDEKPSPEYYIGAIVRFLDAVCYNDINYTPEERVARLQQAYARSVEHFAQPHVQGVLKMPQDKLAVCIHTITKFTVYSFVHVPLDLMADLAIYWTYAVILDDITDDITPMMKSWYSDLLEGRPQAHNWWQLTNSHFPAVLKHYGPYCQMNMVRSTIDFFQGRWIELRNFKAFRGSLDYPGFLRRMNGLGQSVGASLWPMGQFDEEALFPEITTAISQVENWMIWVNDLFSFYKESNGKSEEKNLVQNYCATEGISITEAFDKLCENVIDSSERMTSVFCGSEPRMIRTLTSFMHGYITWHLCDPRYRLNELYDGLRQTPISARFSDYYQEAWKTGGVDPREYS